MKKYLLLCCGMALSGWGASGTITLEQALELARNQSPALRAARLNTRAAEKAVDASGRWRNPSLKFQAENVGGDLDGFDETEYTVMISQTLQRGGKRRSEQAVARETAGAALHIEAERELNLLADVRRAFFEVVFQQEVGKVRADQEQLGRAFVKVAAERFEAGGASELETVEAELAMEEILLSQTCCFGDLKAGRIRLASLIGVPEEEMGELSTPYYRLEPIDPATAAVSHPVLRRLDAEIAAAQARAERAGAKDAADLTLAAGYRYETGGEINTFVLGASMPLNVVRAGRAEQAAELTRVESLTAEREERLRAYRQQLASLAAIYEGAKTEADMVRDRLMPKAEKCYKLSKSGYEAGRFSWVELITAQQQLAEIRVRHIEALRDAHLARADISKYLMEGI
jgi:cobalt-zinc-cadmium efflux system outer membrane protein